MLINSFIVETIKNHYHARSHNNDYSKFNLGFGFIHYALIRNIRPENVLVVGSQRGYVPAICALACKDEGKGKVDFVDAGYDLNSEDKKEADNSWGGIGIWKDLDEDYWKPLKLDEYIDVYCMKTEEFKEKVKDKKYQYIYIDGDHSYEGVSLDFNLFYWENLAKNGYMVFHDVYEDKETDWGKCGVKEFWNELKEKKAINMIDFPFEAGLGVIQGG